MWKSWANDKVDLVIEVDLTEAVIVKEDKDEQVAASA
jgi:hypothetical protein